MFIPFAGSLSQTNQISFQSSYSLCGAPRCLPRGYLTNQFDVSEQFSNKEQDRQQKTGKLSGQIDAVKTTLLKESKTMTAPTKTVISWHYACPVA
ncbi:MULTISPECIES: hypothetical protein [Pseudomonas]|uniref:Uncharacterized protein n=1 Tax=Pseudomonas umsongensis TaxID=198618 RepID=A0ACC5MF66_9PSED|nr:MULTISPECIES: hypothetical protein [Pseudomonas]MBB2887394.1 hypothetical protein [Pseudomonas umsongensis]